MNRKIRKSVFPAAGFGIRFLPATKAMPKEFLPIVDKNLIQYAQGLKGVSGGDIQLANAINNYAQQYSV